MDELGSCLRAWRDRLEPAAAGLPAGGHRRAPGLRREEVARLAGVSVDYLARLEQGRATTPSPSVLAALARTLRLTESERDYLFRLADQAPPTPGQIERHLTPGVRRVLDRMPDAAVLVTDAAWQLIDSNDLAVALLGDLRGLPHRERNLAWRAFAGLESRVDQDAAARAREHEEIAAELREAFGRHPHDAALRRLIDDLHGLSAEFGALWASQPPRPCTAGSRTVVHPQVGPITLDCDVLAVRGSDVRIMVLSAGPDSAAAEALRLVQTIGLQDLASPDPTSSAGDLQPSSS
ncbi:helix-turn-helix transcriptional regulator [Frankia sp. Cpl3]|nr:helix-turn-helix transcriptional regulator [Frankia sp. Cpl3]